MSLKIKVDIQSLAQQCKEFALEAEHDLKKGVAGLAASTHANVAMMASQELHSSRKDFMDNLGFEEIAEGIWVVSIDEKGLWIEEGLEAGHDMKPDLLKNAKTSKNGYRYQIIPFEHTKPPSQTTDTAKDIVRQIKNNLKKERIPYKKIEKDSRGKPKLGKLHSFSWDSAIPGRGNTPVLSRVSIYQNLNKQTGKVQRDIFTFRTVSENPKSNGKWIHPGVKAKKYLDIAAEWAMRTWENEILPEILNKWK